MKYRIDENDRKIIEAIRYDARKSFTAIGNEVGISRVSVKSRMHDMEEAGIITGYHTITNVDEEKTDEIAFILDIATRTDQFDSIIEALKRRESMKKIFIMTGKNRLVVIGAAPNMTTLHRNVEYFRRKVEGIVDLHWSVVLAEVK